MSARANAHRLIDALPEEEMETIERLLSKLTTLDPLERTLLLAPPDDESDDDDGDGGLTRARQEMARGEGITTEELKQELGIE